MEKNVTLISIPLDDGASQRGCRMGPDALIVAGLREALIELGAKTVDERKVLPQSMTLPPHPNTRIHNLEEIAAWTAAISQAAKESAADSFPIFLGGDHALSAGSVAGIASAAKAEGKPLFVLWLDAHSDFNTLDTTDSGNLHGTPVAYFTGQTGFEGYFPPLDVAVREENLCMLGLRSVDAPENERLMKTQIITHDMRAVDEFGIVRLLRDFIGKVKAADGWLHVSLDVDFLDPEIAPAVGTTVPGGANFREAHLIMEMLHETGLVRSLDLVELNPFLDHRGKTARLLVDLTASLFGKRIMDRKTRSY